MKNHPGEQMSFRVLRGKEEETSDPSVPRLGVLLKMMVRETESQFWNRKLVTFFLEKGQFGKETKNKETRSESEDISRRETNRPKN